MLDIISTPSKEVLNFDVMASIVPGYEYDIFISYRQKDNKYEGWVTEFVDNLKRDQINKVANGVKEIIRGLAHSTDVHTEFRSINSEDSSNEGQKIISEKSIAVLPFTDMSPAHDQEYLGDGLAESLLNILSQIKELKVTGRSSSFSFKNKNIDLTTIGKALNVENILEGSLQKAENRVRITAQLINAVDGFHIWSQRYDREMDDIFALQDDICSNISEHLKVTLLEKQDSVISKRPTKNSEAYELFLKGDFYCKKYSELVSQFPYFLHVKVNTYLGNIDEAFVYLDKAVTEKNESGVLAELIFI